ncbi:MAG TPA: hypothetical protein ENH39_01400 [Gammaproteobacteria bacterium]|nr:hypothetical protein [Gammaproteobacteria bacterium]
MRLFVSYTRRDGVVTKKALEDLNEYLCSICTPFIHAVEEPNIKWQQISVVKAIFRSHAVLLVNSPEVHQSPWVKFELILAKILFMPVMHIEASSITKSSITSKSSGQPKASRFLLSQKVAPLSPAAD